MQHPQPVTLPRAPEIPQKTDHIASPRISVYYDALPGQRPAGPWRSGSPDEEAKAKIITVCPIYLSIT